MSTNKIVRLIILVILPLILLLLGYFDELNFNLGRERIRCEREERARNLSWDGVLVDKYINQENHNAKMLVIDNSEVGLIKTSILTIDNSGLFDAIEVGDTIAKNRGKLSVKLTNFPKETIIVLDYNCE